MAIKNTAVPINSRSVLNISSVYLPLIGRSVDIHLHVQIGGVPHGGGFAGANGWPPRGLDTVVKGVTQVVAYRKQALPHRRQDATQRGVTLLKM